jgi:hypothetical protein
MLKVWCTCTKTTIELDKETNITKWQEAEAIKIGQLLEHESFVDKELGGKIPPGYKTILAT